MHSGGSGWEKKTDTDPTLAKDPDPQPWFIDLYEHLIRARNRPDTQKML